MEGPLAPWSADVIGTDERSHHHPFNATTTVLVLTLHLEGRGRLPEGARPAHGVQATRQPAHASWGENA